MKPLQIILIRHGQSEANVNRILHETKPDYRMDLTPKGRKQATAAGKRVHKLIGGGKLAVFFSPYFRTRQTKQGILSQIPKSQVGKQYEDPRLREQEFGNYPKASEFEVFDKVRKAFGTFYYRVKDGESGADVYDRCTGVLDTMYRDFTKPDFPENMLIVTHGLTIRLLLMRWLHWTVEEFEHKRNPENCEIFILKLQKNGKYKLVTPLRVRKD